MDTDFTPLSLETIDPSKPYIGLQVHSSTLSMQQEEKRINDEIRDTLNTELNNIPGVAQIIIELSGGIVSQICTSLLNKLAYGIRASQKRSTAINNMMLQYHPIVQDIDICRWKKYIFDHRYFFAEISVDTMEEICQTFEMNKYNKIVWAEKWCGVGPKCLVIAKGEHNYMITEWDIAEKGFVTSNSLRDNDSEVDLSLDIEYDYEYDDCYV
eukprot:72031_1